MKLSASTLVFFGILSITDICTCQMELGSMLSMQMLSRGGGGMLGGLFGGGMSGGMPGMSGLAGMSGMAGMSGLGGMFGGNRNLAMAGMAGLTGDLSPADLAVLTNAVKSVVGKHASPDFMMYRFAAMQEGRPKTFMEMIPYISIMVEIARKVGLQMPDGSIQFPIGSSSSSSQRNQFVLARMSGGKAGGSAPNTSSMGGGLTLQKLREIVNRRTMTWFARSQMMRRAGLLPA